MSVFGFAEYHVQQTVARNMQTVQRLLELSADKNLTHWQRNHINTVIALLVDETIAIVRPPAGALGEVPF